MTSTSRLARLQESYRRLDLSDAAKRRIFRQAFKQHKRSASPGAMLRWGLVGAAMGATICAALWWRRDAGSDQYAGVVYRLSGQASVSSPTGLQHALSQEMVLEEGATLATEQASLAEVRIGPHLVQVQETSVLSLDRLSAPDLQLGLSHGTIRLVVSTLGPNSRLSVSTQELRAEVVGTAFSVTREGECSSVVVDRGRVRTSSRDGTIVLEAGGQTRSCSMPSTFPNTVTPPKQDPDLTPANSAVPSASQGSPAAPLANLSALLPMPEEIPSALVADLPVPAAQPTSAPSSAAEAEISGLSEEEKLFKEATRTGNAVLLRQYLNRYPAGMFAEDALVHLIRSSYASRQTEETARLSEQFLGRFRASRRSSEVQLLYVQSLVEMGRAPSSCLPILQSLLARLDTLPRTYQEQIVYLALLAYCGPNGGGACQQWARVYQERFPSGAYINQVRRMVPER